MPLAGNSINLAGRPSKVGGTVTRVFGWVVLVVGLLTAFGVLGACGAIVGFASAAPYLLGVPLALVSVVVGYLLLKGGSQLHASGAQAEKNTRMQALLAVANTRGGAIVAADAARALSMSEADADAYLTRLAKEHPEQVAVDLDEQGTILYRFLSAFPVRPRVDMAPNARVADLPGLRVDGASPEEQDYVGELDRDTARGPHRARQPR